MALSLMRFDWQGQARWGQVTADGIAPLAVSAQTTAQVLALGISTLRASATTERLRAESLAWLSPITAPCRIVCQGANYRQHMIESGLDPDAKDYNLFFTKSDAAIAPARGELRAPPHVRLLDYELELGLVMGRQIDGPVTVQPEELPRYVAALVMANDVSARDVQLPQMQWHKGKSYRGFCPLGPYLCVLEPQDYALLESLELRLSVNAELRQSDSTAHLVFKPAETLSELSTFANLAPGDVLLTGTPSGCAFRAPSALLQKLSGLLPDATKWRLFVRGQMRRAAYLRPGDVIRSSIRSADGALDLGTQDLLVRR